MATRARIVQNVPALIERLANLQAVFARIKDAQDLQVNVDNNPLLPLTVTNAQRQEWRANFDAEKDAIIAEIEAWKV